MLLEAAGYRAINGKLLTKTLRGHSGALKTGTGLDDGTRSDSSALRAIAAPAQQCLDTRT